LHDRFILLRGGGGVWFHKTSLAPPRFIEVPVPSEESERVRSVDFAYFYDLSIIFWSCFDSVVFFVFPLDFGAVSTAWYFLFFY
jgi:hypothetical protein